MNPTREEALFALALDKPAEKRPAFLDAMCEGNPALRRRLEALLAAREQPERVLAEAAPAAPPTMKIEFAGEPAGEGIGQKIGRYKILEKVGEGGCGVVYVAEQTEPVRRRVAFKVIKLGMDTKAVVARFEAERQALAMMDHPNIAKVLDAGSTETGRPYFVMELVRGIRITDYCDQNNLPTQERLDLFIKVCQAIQHAHQKGIIHRDIKPSNILVTLHDGVPVPKVIDFGIAKATEGRLTDATVYTQIHQFIGTPAYMSPEQAEMSGLDIDTRSDIYSLGVLLYELLTGKTPFDAQELMSQGMDAMRKTIREKMPVKPSTRLHTLPGEELTTTAKRHGVDVPKLASQLRGDLDWIVMKCLEKDRTRRYETANGLALDLKRHLTNEPVLARPPSKLYEFQKTVRRHKVGFAATAAIILVLAVGVSVSSWQAARATRARIAADASRQDAQMNEAKARSAEASATAQRDLAQDRLLDSLIREMRSTATLRPAGYRSILRERVHQALELSHSSRRRDELRAEFTQALGDPIGLDPVLIRWETNQPGVFRMALTSDGELAAIWTDEGGLEIRETANGKRMAKLEIDDPIGDLAFSPDGRTLFGRVLDSNSPAAQLHEWRHGSGGSWTPRVHGTVVVNRFLRTPKAVFALERKAPSEFELVNLETQETLTPFQLGPRQLPRALAVSDDGWIACGVGNDVDRHSAAIEVWRPDHAQPRVRLDNLPGMGSLVAAGFSPDGRLLVCAGESGLVVYEIPGFKIIKKHFTYLGTMPYPPAFAGEGSIVAVSLFQQSGIRLLDLTSQTDTLINTPESMPLLTASMDGTTLAGISRKGISFFRLTDTPERRRLAGHIGGVPAVEFSPDGRLVASTGKDGTIRFWEADSGNSWRVLRQENAVGQSVAFSPDGRWLASADYSHDQIRIWSIKTGTQALTLGQLQPGSGQVWGCGFSPDGRCLVSVGHNGLRIWKISDAATNNGLEAELIVEQPGSFRNLLIDSRRPAIVFSGFIDPGVGLRAFVRGLGPKDELKSVGTGTSGLVQAIGMTPDTGELILSDPYPDRQTLHFWDPDTRTEIRTLQALVPGEVQTGGAGNLRVSPDGKKLAIANHTGRRVNIHDVATGRRLYSLPDEPGVIWWLAWRPDSRRLAVSRDHGDISIWKLDTVEAALAEVGLTP